MTVMEPTNSTLELLNNNYRGNPKYTRKTECAFAISKSLLNPTKLYDVSFRDIWRNDSPIDLTKTEYFVILREGNQL